MKLLLLSLLSIGIGLGQDPTLIAHTAATSPDTNPISTSAINTTGANTLLVCYGASTAGNVASPISDTIGGSPSGNTWTLIKHLPFLSDTQGSIWASFAANVGANHVFTAAGYAPALAVSAWSGISSGQDTGAASGTGVISAEAEGGSSPLALGTLLPTLNNELIMNCMTGHVGSGGALAASSPLTTLDQIPSPSGSVYGIMSGYEIQTTATSTSVSDTYAGTLSYSVALAAAFFSVANPAPLSFNTTSLPEGFETVSYNFPLSISGGNHPYTCTITVGTLPAGLSQTGTGGCTISGTPTATASATPLTFHVVDSTSPTPLFLDSSGLTLTVASTPLVISTTTCPGGTQYASYAGCTISFSGGTSPLTLSVSTSSSYAALPEGLSLNASTGAITSSYITAQGGYGVLFVLTDNLGSTVTREITFAMAGSNAWMQTVFPANSIWHHRVDAATTGLQVYTGAGVSVNSVYLHPSFGATPLPQPNGIPALLVPYNQATNNVQTNTYQCYFGTSVYSGTVNTSGTSVTGVSSFNGSGFSWFENEGVNATTITINGTPYTIASLNNTSSITLTTSAGTQTGVAYSVTTSCGSGSPSVAPIPLTAPVEGSANSSSDKHVIVYQQAGGGDPAALYEMWEGVVTGSSYWTAASNYLINPTSNQMTPQCNTGVPCGSTDAAGMPIIAGLLTADDVIGTGTPTSPNGTVTHPTRFTLSSSTVLRAWFWPGTAGFEGGGSCAGVGSGVQIYRASPPSSCSAERTANGGWLRLKATVISDLAAVNACFASSPQASIIALGLANYGMYMADQGSSGYLTGTPDSRWVDSDLSCLSHLNLQTHFEAVDISPLMVNGDDSFQAETGTGSQSSAGSISGGLH